MLSGSAWDKGALEPYLSRWIQAEPAREPWQRREYFALRQAVFVAVVEWSCLNSTAASSHRTSAVRLSGTAGPAPT